MIVRSASMMTNKMLNNVKEHRNYERALPPVYRQPRHSNTRNRLLRCKTLMWLQAPEQTQLARQAKYKAAGGSLADPQGSKWIKTRRKRFCRNGEAKTAKRDLNLQYLSRPKASRVTQAKPYRKKVESPPMFRMLIWMLRPLRILSENK